MSRGRVLLHIGTPKSGTTYLQARMEANLERAAADGVRWVGGTWDAQVKAVGEVRALSDHAQPGEAGPWARLVADVGAHPEHDALVSMEWLCALAQHQVGVVARAFEGREVHVLVTARDLQRNVVAQWQEMTRNYRTWTWDHFLSSIRDVDADSADPCARTFWRQQEVLSMLDRWSHVAPPERTHLVTVPPSGSDPGVLWSRWCDVLGIDGSAYVEPDRDNASTGVVSTVLMQRLNVVARRRDVKPATYHPLLHGVVARQLLPVRRADEGGIGVDDDTVAWVGEQARAQVEGLRDSGVRLAGDLGDLVPGTASRGRDPRDVTDTELLATCEDAFVQLAVQQFRELGRRGERITELEGEVAALRDRPPQGTWGRRASRVSHGARRVAGALRRPGRARRGVRAARRWLAP